MARKPDGTPILLCALPGPLRDSDAEVYAGLRRAHCPHGHERDRCVGTLTIDRAGLTLQCPACGDSRALWPREGAE